MAPFLHPKGDDVGREEMSGMQGDTHKARLGKHQGQLMEDVNTICIFEGGWELHMGAPFRTEALQLSGFHQSLQRSLFSAPMNGSSFSELAQTRVGAWHCQDRDLGLPWSLKPGIQLVQDRFGVSMGGNGNIQQS